MIAYLADTSAMARRGQAAVAVVLEPRVEARQVALCVPVVGELLRGAAARTVARLREALDWFPAVRLHEAIGQRGLEVQAALATRGQHKGVSVVDLLVAAAAEANGLTVLHYDADFDRIAEVTGQPTEWIVPAGTAD